MLVRRPSPIAAVLMPILLAMMAVAAGAQQPAKPAKQPGKTDSADAPRSENVVAPADRPAQKPVQLAYRFTPGEVIRYEVTHTMEITTRKDQTSETATNESKAWKHLKVIDVDDKGTATLELTIDRVQMSARFGESDPVAYDSEQPEKAPRQFRNVQETVGKPHGRIKVTPGGNLISAVRLLEDPSQPRSAAPGDIDQISNFLVDFPDGPVAVGETWKDDPVQTVRVSVPTSKTLTRNVEILRKYRLASVDGPLATIEVTSAILTPVHDPAMRAQLIQRAPEGTIVFDMERGRIVSRQMKLDKTEIGVFGDNSSMRAVSNRQERLVP